MHDIEDMGYVYLTENSNETISHFDTVKINGIWSVVFDMILQSFGVMNRNQRIYDQKNIWNMIQTDEKIQSELAHNGWFMELNHPTSPYKDKPLSPERIQNIDYDRRCAVIKNPRMEGNLLKGHIQTTCGGLGPDLANDMIGIGYKPMASCRAIASLNLRNGKPLVFVRKLIAYDIVQYASHREADMTTPGKVVTKAITESADHIIDTVKEAVDNVCIPLKEILESVGVRDYNTQVVMEAFDIPMDNLIGINKDRTHAIILDRDNNTIYTKMSPDTVKEVNDFFASF